MLTEAEVSILLNRSLTTAETTNFDLYLKIATTRLEELLCMNLCRDDGERIYETREGYRDVYVDPFTEIDEITVDGNLVSVDDYTFKQNNRLNGSWYNIIQFDKKQTGKRIVVDAAWGFPKLPVDLQNLLANMFAQGSVEKKSDNRVQSKRIEDFTVTYKDSATFNDFVLSNSAVVDKYSQCNQGALRHGSVCTISNY